MSLSTDSSMVESLPSPPVTRETTPKNVSEELDAIRLRRHLDELLEQYLELLDQYTTLREELSKHLADGFFTLARAQRTSSPGSGQRYGQDGFDGRMKALKRVNIATRGGTQYTRLGAESEPEGNRSDFIQIRRLDLAPLYNLVSHAQADDGQSRDSPALTLQATENKSQPSKEATEVKTQTTKIDPAYRDPATWYSILVPPTLRQAQLSFSKSIEVTTPKLLNTISSMRALETLIDLARSRVGQRAD